VTELCYEKMIYNA